MVSNNKLVYNLHEQVYCDEILDGKGEINMSTSNVNVQLRDNGLANRYVNEYVLIRSYASGVHFGILEAFDPENNHVLMKNVRRIYEWSGAFTLSKVCTDGITEGKLSCFVIEPMLITQVIEVMPCTEEAIECLKNMKEHA